MIYFSPLTMEEAADGKKIGDDWSGQIAPQPVEPNLQHWRASIQVEVRNGLESVLANPQQTERLIDPLFQRCLSGH